jgi:hypothetical protein
MILPVADFYAALQRHRGAAPLADFLSALNRRWSVTSVIAGKGRAGGKTDRALSPQLAWTK